MLTEKEQKLLNSNLIKTNYLLLATALFQYSPLAYSVAGSITQQAQLSFGELVPKSGFCELDPINGNISSPDNMCLGNAQLAHYRIQSTPNTQLIVRFNYVEDGAQGLSFAPKARLVNDLNATSLSPIAGADTWFMTGTDGVIELYVGGTLTISNALSGLTSYNMSFDVEFREP